MTNQIKIAMDTPPMDNLIRFLGKGFILTYSDNHIEDEIGRLYDLSRDEDTLLFIFKNIIPKLSERGFIFNLIAYRGNNYRYKKKGGKAGLLEILFQGQWCVEGEQGKKHFHSINHSLLGCFIDIINSLPSDTISSKAEEYKKQQQIEHIKIKISDLQAQIDNEIAELKKIEANEDGI